MPALTPGVPSALSPLVRRIVAPNPGPFTGPGTNTYLVGIDEVAVIDPGPDDKVHIDAIIGASMKERVRWVLLTHTHPDHAPGTARLVDATGAEVLAYGKRLDKDNTITPDRVIGDGDTIEGTEFGLEVLHTPGHAPNHLCFMLEEERVLFTGDTVLGRGTTVVAHPDGELAAYLDSLERLRSLTGDGSVVRILPGHGPVVPDAAAMVAFYRMHRAERLDQVRQALADGAAVEDDPVEGVLRRVYAEVPSAVWPAARLSIRAQLEYLSR